jgi:hypothetical protein
MSKEDVEVKISRELYEAIVRRVRESEGEFNTVEDYLEFVLKNSVEERNKGNRPDDVYTAQEEEEIKKRLRSLGYL